MFDRSSGASLRNRMDRSTRLFVALVVACGLSPLACGGATEAEAVGDAGTTDAGRYPVRDVPCHERRNVCPPRPTVTELNRWLLDIRNACSAIAKPAMCGRYLAISMEFNGCADFYQFEDPVPTLFAECVGRHLEMERCEGAEDIVSLGGIGAVALCPGS
jgi:hypothetical protein